MYKSKYNSAERHQLLVRISDINSFSHLREKLETTRNEEWVSCLQWMVDDTCHDISSRRRVIVRDNLEYMQSIGDGCYTDIYLATLRQLQDTDSIYCCVLL